MSAQFFIGGHWVPPSSGRLIDAVDPSTGGVLDQIAAAEHFEVDQAVAAGRAAFAVWSATPPPQRIELVAAAISSLDEQKEELAGLLCREVGTPIAEGAGQAGGTGPGDRAFALRVGRGAAWRETDGGMETSRDPVASSRRSRRGADRSSR